MNRKKHPNLRGRFGCFVLEVFKNLKVAAVVTFTVTLLVHEAHEASVANH